jgi:hypothetical protein
MIFLQSQEKVAEMGRNASASGVLQVIEGKAFISGTETYYLMNHFLEGNR